MPVDVDADEEELFVVLGGEGLSWQDGRSTRCRGRLPCCTAPAAEAHTIVGAGDGLDVLAFGQRLRTGLTWLPRAGAFWAGPALVPHDGPNPFDAEDAAGPLELPSPRPPARDRHDRPIEDDAREAFGRGTSTPCGTRRRGAGQVRRHEGRGSSPAGRVPPHCHSAEEELFVVLGGDGRCVLGDASTRSARAASSRARPAPAWPTLPRGCRRAAAARLRRRDTRRHVLLPALAEGRAARPDGSASPSIAPTTGKGRHDRLRRQGRPRPPRRRACRGGRGRAAPAPSRCRTSRAAAGATVAAARRVHLAGDALVPAFATLSGPAPAEEFGRFAFLAGSGRVELQGPHGPPQGGWPLRPGLVVLRRGGDPPPAYRADEDGLDLLLLGAHVPPQAALRRGRGRHRARRRRARDPRQGGLRHRGARPGAGPGRRSGVRHKVAARRLELPAALAHRRARALRVLEGDGHALLVDDEGAQPRRPLRAGHVVSRPAGHGGGPRAARRRRAA